MILIKTLIICIRILTLVDYIRVRIRVLIWDSSIGVVLILILISVIVWILVVVGIIWINYVLIVVGISIIDTHLLLLLSLDHLSKSTAGNNHQDPVYDCQNSTNPGPSSVDPTDSVIQHAILIGSTLILTVIQVVVTTVHKAVLFAGEEIVVIGEAGHHAVV